MDNFFRDATAFRLLAEALAIGLLVGVERYRARKPGVKRFGGVRTFAAISLIGGICGLLETPLFAAVSFAGIAALITVGYLREVDKYDIGLTTEMAALAVFWLAYLLFTNETLAVSATIVLAILLATKRGLHDFAKDAISEREFFDTLKFLAVVLVVYPLLPDRQMGPWGFLNPAKVWFFVVLVSSVSYGGYLLVRWLGPKRGLLWSTLAGGLVSTTAMTLSLAGRARRAPQTGEFLGTASGFGNAVQLPKILLLAWVANRLFGLGLSGPLMAGTTVGALAIWILSRRRSGDSNDTGLAFRNPFSLIAALRFGALFLAVGFTIRAAEASLGDRGIVVASLLGGAASATAVTLSAADLMSQGALSLDRAILAALLALTTNAIVKTGLAASQGTTTFALRTGLALFLILAASWLVFLGLR